MSTGRTSFGGLGSAVAARTFALFAACAVAPILLAAVIADRAVTARLTSQAQERLTQASKSYGLMLFERLKQSEGTLAELADAGAHGRLTLSDIAAFHSAQFKVVDVQSTAAPQFQSRPSRVIVEDNDVRLRVTRSAAQGTWTIIAQLENEYLWNDEAISIPDSQICVTSTVPVLKHCFGSNSDSTNALTAQWSLYLDPQFGAPAWQITTRQSRAVALHALDSFERTLPLATGIAALIAMLFSIVQIRRSHRPLALLTEAAVRLGRRHTRQFVDIRSRDEFGQLARTFNRMSAGLARQFRVLRQLSRMDRMILADPDTVSIVERMLPALSRLLRSPVALVVALPDEQVELFVAQDPERLMRTGVQGVSLELLIGDPTAIAALLPGWTGDTKAIAIHAETELRGALLLPGIAKGIKERQRLAAAFARRFAIAFGSDERRKALLRQAYFDALTGLPNRQLFKDRLEREVQHARHESRRFALLYVDLDRFKHVNDSLGHSAGDELLVEVSKRLKAAMHDADTLARLGGDEFVVIASGIEEHPVHLLAERLQRQLEEPFVLRGSHCFVQASIGLTLYPQDGETPEALLRNADIAMYRSKAAGRGCVTYFEEEMNRHAQQRLRIEQRLRQALREQSLTLHYQPKVSLVDGSLLGVEALARWTDKELGVVSPGVFIPVAEECGLIAELGQWALREACLEQQRLLATGTDIVTVSVNVSMRQLRDVAFVDTVRTIIAETGIAPTALELEITESALADDPARAAEMLMRLRELGVRISIDDFGTGYSSMSSLAVLPTDILKIDRSFVKDCASRKSARSVAAAIISLAHSLGKITVAEGVETIEQLQTLRELGCDVVQGYLLARPMPAEMLARTCSETSAWKALVESEDWQDPLQLTA